MDEEKLMDKEKNDSLRSKILKNLEELGESPSLLQENEIAFGIKGFHHCIMKYPYNKITANLFDHDDRQSTTN